MRGHLHLGQWIKCPTLRPGNVVNLISPRLQHYVRSSSLGDHQEILSRVLRTHYGQESLFKTSCRYEMNYIIQFVGADAILIQRPTIDKHLAQYATKDIIPRPERLTTIHVLRICQSRLGPGACSTHPDVIGYTIQISTHGVIHDTALGLDSDSRSLTLAQESDCPKTSFWIPGSVLRVMLPELVKQFTGKKSFRHLETTLLYAILYVFDSSYKPSPHRFFPLCLNLRSKKIDCCCTIDHPLVILPVSISS
jgi:hypothetical protein